MLFRSPSWSGASMSSNVQSGIGSTQSFYSSYTVSPTSGGDPSTTIPVNSYPGFTFSMRLKYASGAGQSYNAMTVYEQGSVGGLWVGPNKLLSTCSNGWSTPNTKESGKDIVTDQWFLLTYVHDKSSGTDKIYVDDKLWDSRTGCNYDSTWDSTSLGFAHRNPDNNYGGGGYYDNFIIWKRALSQSDVSTLYNTQSGNIGDSTTPDSSGNSITPTASSGSTSTAKLSNGILAPSLTMTSALLPDANDAFTVGGWVKNAPVYTNGLGATADLSVDRKSTRLNSSHVSESRMPSSA